jgi:hypothetical protein
MTLEKSGKSIQRNRTREGKIAVSKITKARKKVDPAGLGLACFGFLN